MRLVSEAVGASVSFIVVHDFIHNVGSRFFDFGISERSLQAYFDKYASLNPIAALKGMELGTVKTLAAMFDDDRWERSVFNREWVRPQGLRDVIGAVVLRNQARSAWLGALRSEHRGQFSARDIELLSLLTPHVVRSLQTSDTLNLKTVTSDRLAETLDSLTVPVLLLDADARIVYQNEASRLLVRSGQALQIRHGKLMLVSSALQEPLTAALTAIKDATKDFRAISFPTGDSVSGEGAMVTILPLHHCPRVRCGPAQRRQPCSCKAGTNRRSRT